MTRRLILRPAVPDDLRDIVLYLEQTSTAVADRFLEATFKAFDDLALMPGKGSLKHFRSARLAGVRSWWVPGFPNHVIYYQTHADAIVILGVLHGARHVKKILQSRQP